MDNDDDFSNPNLNSPPPQGHRDVHGHGLASSSSVASGLASRPGYGGGGFPVDMSGLDLSFGYTPTQFEKINLLGSNLGEHAISSLVLSVLNSAPAPATGPGDAYSRVQNVTYLDLRGNGLNAAFGWRLVKAMKRRYMKLDFCNGVNTKQLREDSTDSLNLSSFGIESRQGHHGLYGIEVVGAIFLAHFLRLNKSLTHLNFSRNDVQKDGAKALAQAVLNNPESVLRHVNSMGPNLCPGPQRNGKPGIQFTDFKTNSLRKVELSKRMLDDDDFVFLEEWLRKYDCVTHLDISHNLIGQPRWDGTGYTRDGLRKLTRYIKDTKSLTFLNCVGLPVDLEGTATLARAVAESTTLEHIYLPLGPCDEKPERQSIFQTLGMSLAKHPTIQQMGLQAKFAEPRSGTMQSLDTSRMVQAWPRSETAVYLWAVTALRPPLDTLTFGSKAQPTKAIPEPGFNPPELFPPIIGLVHDCRTLQTVSISIPKGYGPLMVELMRALARCNGLRSLNLNGYPTARMKDSQLPPDWVSPGAVVPRWLLDDRVKKIRVHWLALNGLLGSLPALQTFNGIAVDATVRETPERITELLYQCIEGVAAEFGERDPVTNELILVAQLNKDANVDDFCDILRIMSRMNQQVLVELTFTSNNTEHVKAQMLKLAPPLKGAPAGEAGPRFTHAVKLKNDFVSEGLIQTLDHNSPLREFCYERLDAILPSLYAAFCARERPLPVEKIRIKTKWDMGQRFVRTRFDATQRKYLESIQTAMMQRSERFQEVESNGNSQSKEDLASLSLEEFTNLMSGLSVDDPPRPEQFHAMTSWRTFSSAKNYTSQLPPSDELENPPVYTTLPLDDDMKNSIKKLSFCMCGLRSKIAKVARQDEWAGPSRDLWWGPRRLKRVGDWNEDEDEPMSPGAEEEDEDPDAMIRYHWRRSVRIGARAGNMDAFVKPSAHAGTFQDDLLQESLKSLLTDTSSLAWLDLRGNGLTREDANVLLSWLEEPRSCLETLNQIPVTLDLANVCRVLELDGSGIQKEKVKKEDDPFGDDDDEPEPQDEQYAQQAIEAEYVRLDEGDGFLFLSLVNERNFKELQSVVIKRHEIPDSTLHHICDALLNIGWINRLQLTDLKLTGQGANLLLGAIAEMAPRLVSLNNLPLNRLLQLRDSADNPLELSGPIEWNDFTLGVMSKLQLWPVATWPLEHEDRGPEFVLQGHTITDVGMRGLSGMLRHFAGGEQPARQGSLARGHLNLVKIDVSGNNQITDGPVADLCHTLLHPTSGALRHSLKELNLRSCSRLRSRSAHELLQLIQRLREAALSSGSQSPALGSSLQMLSGVDLTALQAFVRTSGSSRAQVPPMLLRSFVKTERHPHTVMWDKLSECDVNYFAGILHLFPTISYCHLHVVIPTDSLSRVGFGEPCDVWGETDKPDGTPVIACSNQSPFPPPMTATATMTKSIQRHFDMAKKLFETCPISTQLRLSIVPAIPGVEDILAAGDHSVLTPLGSAPANSSLPSGIFTRAQKRLVETAQKKRKAMKPKNAEPAPPGPRRPLYVNNINSQRLHDCFRSLYGQDDVELEHEDIFPSTKSSVRLPPEVDVTQSFEVATSVDLQHLDLGVAHLVNLKNVSDMHALTHMNLNHNLLGDTGVELLFDALVSANSTVVHVALSDNNMGDWGAELIAASLPRLPRLTSLELCDNFIQQKGSIAIAEAIGGILPQDEQGADEPQHNDPLPMLSIDLRGNKSRYIGAMRWAEVVILHPKLQFLCLAQNELGTMNTDSFVGLVYAAVASASLSVLDLRENFPVPGSPTMGPPPEHILQELLADLQTTEFDPMEVKQAVFIRRHRGGGGHSKGRAPQK